MGILSCTPYVPLVNLSGFVSLRHIETSIQAIYTDLIPHWQFSPETALVFLSIANRKQLPFRVYWKLTAYDLEKLPLKFGVEQVNINTITSHLSRQIITATASLTQSTHPASPFNQISLQHRHGWMPLPS